MTFGLVTQCVATSPQPAGGVSCSSLPRMAGKKPVLGPNRPLSDDLHPECSLVTFEMKRNGPVYFQYTHTSADGESKRPKGVLGAAKIRDLTRPPGSSESEYDDLRTAAVATAVAAWLRKKHGEVADETNDDAPASLRSEAPASSPGNLSADDAAMDETLSGTAIPNRETTCLYGPLLFALRGTTRGHHAKHSIFEWPRTRTCAAVQAMALLEDTRSGPCDRALVVHGASLSFSIPPVVRARVLSARVFAGAWHELPSWLGT